jgi:hypothetical protein
MVWLLQEKAAGDRTGRDRREARGVDHRQLRMMLAAAFGNLPAVDLARKADVGDQKLGDPALAPGQRLFAAGCMDHVIAFFAQGFDDEFADQRIIFDDENTHRQLLGASVVMGQSVNRRSYRSFRGARAALSELAALSVNSEVAGLPRRLAPIPCRAPLRRRQEGVEEGAREGPRHDDRARAAV